MRSDAKVSHKGENAVRVRQLEYFVRVCEAGSITKAAQVLSVAQPALGLQNQEP